MARYMTSPMIIYPNPSSPVVSPIMDAWIDYSGNRECSRSNFKSANWNEEEYSWGDACISSYGMHFMQLWFIIIDCELVWLAYGPPTIYSSFRQRDRRLSTGGVRTPSDYLEVRWISESERGNYSGSNGVRTLRTHTDIPERYKFLWEREVAIS